MPDASASVADVPVRRLRQHQQETLDDHDNQLATITAQDAFALLCDDGISMSQQPKVEI